MSFRTFCVAVGVLAAVRGTAVAQETTTLPMSIVVTEAVTSDPSADAMARRIERLRLATRLAGAPDSMHIRISAVAGEADEEANQITQSIPLGGQPGMRRAVASFELEAAVAARDARRVQIAHQAASTFLRLQTAVAELELARQDVEAYDLILSLTRRRFEAGDVPRSQLVRATRERAAAARAQVNAESARASARGALAVFLARDGEGLPDPAPLVGPPPPSHDVDTLVGIALSARPDLLQARAEMKARRGEAGLARAERSPALEFSLYQARLAGAQQEQGARVSLQWPILDWGRIRASTAEAEARAEEARASSLRLEQTIRVEVQEALARWQRVHRERELLEQEEAAAARELTAILERGYGEGMVTLLEVLEARHALRDLRREDLRLQVRLAEAALDLLRVLGRMPSDTLEIDPSTGGQP